MWEFRVEATRLIETRLSSLMKLEHMAEEHTTEHLHLLNEVREQASIRVASYHKSIAKYFNSRVRSRKIKVGDLVLRRAEVAVHAPGKLGVVWEGTFEVIRQVRKGAYSLRGT